MDMRDIMQIIEVADDTARDIAVVSEALDHSQRLLFHGTHLLRAADIFASDALLARTTDVAHAVSGQTGVSLSRSFDFAHNYRGKGRSVVLVIDATRLRTSPVAYWNAEQRRKAARPDEMEEFYPHDIKPLSRSLISVNSDWPFEKWLAKIRADVQHPNWKLYTDPVKKRAMKTALAAGFPLARSLWNRWQPVRGMNNSGKLHIGGDLRS